jgi:hypothetical protein
MQRARFVGIRQKQGLARAVEVGPHTISRWVAMDVPPDDFRRERDVALAEALKIDTFTLFTLWKSVDPTDVGMNKVAGFLQVGVNDHGEVIINLDKDRTGHITFSYSQARNLAHVLLSKAEESKKQTQDRRIH